MMPSLGWPRLASRFILICLGLFVLFSLARTLDRPLQGTHQWRQSDTLYMAYAYCKEGADFLRPHVGHRQGTTGVAIGEFPLFSELVSLKCQLTGQWDEVTPKLIVYLLLLLNLFLWWKFFVQESCGRFPGFWVFACLMGFAPIVLLHLTIPLPDVLALFLIPAIGLFKKNSRWWVTPVRILGFLVMFLIRPYFGLFIFPVFSTWRQRLGALLVCGIGYLFWYKYWVYTSDLSQYFYTDLRGFSHLVHEVPNSFPRLIWDFFRDQWNFLGIIYLAALWRARQEYRLGIWIFVGVGSALIVLGLRGEHFIIHGYYLLAAAMVSFYLMGCGYDRWRSEWREPVLALMAILGIAAVQHHWNPAKTDENVRLRGESLRLTTEGDSIAVYGPDSPSSFYLALRPGWAFPSDRFRGFNACLAGIKAQVVWDLTEDRFEMRSCPKDQK